MESPIEKIAQELLKNVNCLRCSQNIGTDPGFKAASILELEVPMAHWRRKGSLCGSCNMDLLAFMFPDLEDTDDMLGVREQIARKAAEQGGRAPKWHPER
jgi:hypothetical protein